MSASDFDERVVTVPLGKAKTKPSGKRADAAMTLIREHLARHFDVKQSAVRLDPSLNETVWARGRSKPPSRLRVRAARFVEDGKAVVEAEPAD
jgi:large subunit ribosomal protein L31e